MMRQLISLFLTAVFAVFPCAHAEDGQENWADKQVLSAYMDSAAQAGFEGVIGISGPDGTLMVRAYGDAERGKVRYDDGTLIDIASITKQFTGAAILKLMEQGKLTPSDRLDRFFPNIPADKANITLHQILTHNAGLTNLIGRDEDLIDRKTFLDRIFEAPLERKPGTGYAYSNAGYSLLAVIIEDISGQSYEDYLFENLWRPAGMFTTGYYRPDWRGHGVPVIEEPFKGFASQKALLEHGHGKIWNLVGNGGLLSTAEDMLRWHRALLGDAVLNEASRKLLFTAHVPEDEEGFYYGYGWSVMPGFPGGKLVWHNGGSYFSRAEFWRLTESGFGIFVATHKEAPAPYFIADGIAAILRGDTPKAIKR